MWYKWHRSWNRFVTRLTQRCGQRCPLLHVRGVWTRDPETWRSFYTLLYKLDLIWPALSCGRQKQQTGKPRLSWNDTSEERDLRRPPTLTLSKCGCVWWAADWAALWAEAVSSPSPRPGCPPSGRGRRGAGGSGGRWAAVRRGLLVGRHRGLTSWLVPARRGGSRLLCSLCFRSPPVMRKGKRKGGSHLLHGRLFAAGGGSDRRSWKWQSSTLWDKRGYL